MNKMKKCLFLIMYLLCISLVTFVTTLEVTEVSVVEAATPKLNTKKTYVIKGKTVKLKLKNSNGKVTWTTKNKKIATVNKAGVVKGIKAGKTTITAKYKKKSYRCTVVVETPKLSKTSQSLRVGQNITLKLNGTKQKIVWTTSDKKVATVSKGGKVTAKNAGTAEITATVGGKTYKCRISVTKYTYNMKVLNNPAYGLYGSLEEDGFPVGTTIVIYIKTDNPNDDLILDADCDVFRTINKYDDINDTKYRNSKYISSCMPVKNGYIMTVKIGQPGKVTLKLGEKTDLGYSIEAASIDVTLKDYRKSEQSWQNKIIAQETTADMSDLEKMYALRDYVLKNFKYLPSDGEDHPYFFISHEGVYWEVKEIDCISATNIMLAFAKKLGLKAESTYAGYLHHYYVTVYIDGKPYEIEASPNSDSNIINHINYITLN